MTGSLAARRRAIEHARAAFESGRSSADVGVEVRSSWARCATATSPPAGDAAAATGDALLDAASDLLDELGSVARSEGYLAAVTDADGRLLWTDGDPSMQANAETAGFVAGSDWSESAAGTNAPGLSVLADRPTSVFASEHWSESVHDWVCYAAPVHDSTGGVIGAIDLSSTWYRASDMAGATVRSMARLLDGHLRTCAPLASGVGIDISLLGRPAVLLAGRAVTLTKRQIEILAVLALRGPSTLDELHAEVYGDRAVGKATLKAEVSHLRRALGGAIGSRPYRLTVPVRIDAVEVTTAVRSGSLPAALDLYLGQLLPDSESPYVIDERHHLDVLVRTALLQDGCARDLIRFAAVHPFDREVLEVAERRIDTARACAPDLAAALARLDG